MRAVAELRDVTKTYGTKIVVDTVNLEIREGEILALLGPNGSGKSTILKMLAFIENPTSGEVMFQSEKVNFKNTEKERVQSTLVFQKTTLFGTSVYNNIAYGLKIRKVAKETRDREVKKALELVKLEGFEKRNARKLSGGEQQRVAIARALVLNTKLLLLDEPTANLDPKNVGIIEEVIETVNRENKTTIVMATHNMFQAENTTERVALLLNGRIAEIGTASEIFRNASKNLASFARLENVFSGISRTRNDGTSLIEIDDDLQIEAASKKEGKATVLVRPEDIIVSRKTVNSSARNVLAGKIVGISDMGSTVKLNVDVGKPFVAQITKRSFSEMRLNLNSEVFLTFKASSVYMV